MTIEPAKRARFRDLRDTAIGLGFLLFALALVSYELRSTYEDLRLWRRGTASFAYVTRVNRSWASKNGSRSDRCELEAMLPRAVQAYEPRTLLDMSAANYFTSYEPDSDRNCLGYLHTWQPVVFDPADRKHARFTWGLEESTNGLIGLTAAALGIAVVALIIAGIRRLRARGAHNR